MHGGDEFPAFIGFVGGFLIACLVMAVIHGPCESHEDIVKAGCAEYVIVDPATGRTEFRLKEVK